jgi:hypothetical protein
MSIANRLNSQVNRETNFYNRNYGGWNNNWANGGYWGNRPWGYGWYNWGPDTWGWWGNASPGWGLAALAGADFSYAVAGSPPIKGAANCQAGLLDGQVPSTAAQAQLLNAACQVAYGPDPKGTPLPESLAGRLPGWLPTCWCWPSAVDWRWRAGDSWRPAGTTQQQRRATNTMPA